MCASHLPGSMQEEKKKDGLSASLPVAMLPVVFAMPTTAYSEDERENAYRKSCLYIYMIIEGGEGRVVGRGGSHVFAWERKVGRQGSPASP